MAASDMNEVVGIDADILLMEVPTFPYDLLVFGSDGGRAKSGIRCFRVMGSVMEPMMGALGAGMDLESQRFPLDEYPLPDLFIAIGFERCRRAALGGDEWRRDRRAAAVPSDPAAVVVPRSVSVCGTAPVDRAFPSKSLIFNV